MAIELSTLPSLQVLFKRFNSGVHLNRVQDTDLWVELESNQQDYVAIFAALGFSLVLDSRGFAYFKTEQGTNHTGKLTRRLALLLMLLFEFQADQGLHLMQFMQWRIDKELIEKLWQKYKIMLEAEEFNSVEMIKETFDTATRVGFAWIDEECYQLLPAVHRYLDLFEELAKAERTDEFENDDIQEDESWQ